MPAGYPLSPRDLVLSLRELANDTLSHASMPEGPITISGDGVNMIRPETFWSCRTCAACVEICPVGIEHLPMIVQMRRALLEEGEFDPMLATDAEEPAEIRQLAGRVQAQATALDQEA